MPNQQTQTTDLPSVEPTMAHQLDEKSELLFRKAQRAVDQKQHEMAEHLFRQAIALQPDNPVYLSSFGELLLSIKCYQEALTVFQKAAIFQPDSADIFFCIGMAQDGLARSDQAVASYRIAVRLDPDWSHAWYNLGCALFRLDLCADATLAFEKTVKLGPDWSVAWSNLGCAQFGNDDTEKAMRSWQMAIELDPTNAMAHLHRGRVYQSRSNWQMAIEAYEMALRHAPQMAAAHVDLGICMQHTNNLEAALDHFKAALAINPGQIKVWHLLSAVYVELDRIDDVVAVYRRLLSQNPADHEVHYNMAVALSKKWLIDDAIVHCRKALEINPAFSKATLGLLKLAQYGCDWQLDDEMAPLLDRITAESIAQSKKPDEDPFLNLHRHADPEKNLAVARAWSQAVKVTIGNWDQRPVFEHRPRSRSHKIRIGYLSGDFKDHAMAYHIRGLLRNHDRQRFEVYGYATNRDNGTPYRNELIQYCDQFIPIHALDDKQAANQIYRDRIDILVDLSGHTLGNRMAILALRPAPVQVGYLGFLGTSGADFIDYFITDAVVTPAEQTAYFSEHLVFLPHCYQVNDDMLQISEHPMHRKHFGLPDDKLVFCCFNQPQKINRLTFCTWMDILQQTPDSILWLHDHNARSKANLQNAALAAGVDPQRLVFSGSMSIGLHLARLQLADLALDTFTYNGGSTTANVLWAGVPLIALMGNHIVSRMSASALMALGLDELVVRTRASYIEKAVELALDKARRETVKNRLALAKKQAPLFNTALFTRHIEAAFETMLERFNRGEAPAAIKVQDSGSCRKGLKQGATQSCIDLASLAQTAQEHVDRQQLDRAIGIYEQILQHVPANAEVHHMLGLLYLEQKAWGHAQKHIQLAIDIAPGNTQYRRSLGDLRMSRGNPVGAQTAYQNALRQAPADLDTLINLGNAYYRSSQIEQAKSCYEKVLSMAPQHPKALNNMGKLFADQRQIEAACSCYDQALRFDPEYAEARFNRALLLLLTGDLERGLAEYEWRFQRHSASAVYPHHLSGKRWQGQPFHNQRLLVHCEQGLGDVLQFVRYLPCVKALGGTLILEAQKSLIPLLINLSVVDQLVPFSAQCPPSVAYDQYTPLLSLPRILGTTIATIPRNIPYLEPDKDKAAHWRKRVSGNGFKIGLVWSCSDTTSNRECHLATFEPLLRMPEVTFYGLQKGPGACQHTLLPEGLTLTNLEKTHYDFSDTAAIVANLDLLISVDTSVAHLAGAMGVPVWILLPYACDWRWLLDRDDSPWYPSAKLFRQENPGDWAGVINRVQRELNGLLDRDTPPLNGPHHVPGHGRLRQ